MKRPTGPMWGVLLILVAMIAVSGVSRLFAAKEIIPWRTDWSAAREEARRSNKPVFAYFTASWCAPCQDLKHTTWADAKVDAALRKFVPIKIDIDEHQGPGGAVWRGWGALLRAVGCAGANHAGQRRRDAAQ